QASVVFVFIMQALQQPDGSFTTALLLGVGLLVVSVGLITQMKDPQMLEETSAGSNDVPQAS
ncbi:MAG: hypothetical protein ACWGO1_10115, partial [Anaerolineales bacterium]